MSHYITTHGSGAGDVLETDMRLEDLTLQDKGYLLCDGRELLTEDYPELFSMIGSRYGIRITPEDVLFNIPDLRGHFPQPPPAPDMISEKTPETNDEDCYLERIGYE